MDQGERDRRWKVAQERHAAAQAEYHVGRYRVSAACSYYAAYQAMWVALGDPPKGVWRHGGIVDNFCYGAWTTPSSSPTAFMVLRPQLVMLYNRRIRADYDADMISPTEAQESMQTADEVFDVVAARIGLAR